MTLLGSVEARGKVFESRLWHATVVFLTWMTGSFLVSLLLWVAVPSLALGWIPMAATSGSMAPSIRSGDVVLIDPRYDNPGVGSVVAFSDGASITIHRVVEVAADGSLRTKGDANSLADSTRVRDNLIGTGRLLVPHVGLGRLVDWVWWAVLVTGGLAGAILWRSRFALTSSLALLVVLAGGMVLAGAVFNAVTASAGSRLAAVDIEPPTALTATCSTVEAGSVDVDLNWVVSTTAGVTGYRIQYDPPGAAGWADVGTVASPQDTFTHTIDVSLLGVGIHTYAVEALIGPWFSEFSNTDAVDITQVLSVYACTEL